MALAALIDRAATPLDSVRRAAVSIARGRPLLADLLRVRDRRIAVLATVHTLVAFVLAVFCPVVLFVLGPVLFGVLHVAADVRYLVLRQSLPRWWGKAVLAFCAALVAGRVLTELGAARGLAEGRAEVAVVVAFTALGLVAGARETRASGRALLGAVLLVAVGAAAFAHPRGARLVFAQGHNLVALVLWAALFRRRLAAFAVPAVCIGAASIALGSGALWNVTLRHGLARGFGLHVLQAADTLAPGLRADHAIGLTCAFVFLQSVHYAVWLVFVPQDVAKGPGLLSFRSSGRALVHDFGAAGLCTVALAMVAVLVSALSGALRARNVYLSLGMFHGYLEIALGAYFWARGALAATDRT